MQPGGKEQAAPAPTAEPPLRVLLPSPIGPLGVELIGEAITQLQIDPAESEKERFMPFGQVEGSDFLDEVFGRISEYLAGARRQLEIQYDLAPSGVTGFRRRVLRETAKIPYGRTRTYRKIAEAAGRPDAYRLVLSILLENPIPILIPCHRVITNKSGVGSFVGGQERKRWLLDMEQETLAQGREAAVGTVSVQDA